MTTHTLLFNFRCVSNHRVVMACSCTFLFLLPLLFTVAAARSPLQIYQNGGWQDLYNLCVHSWSKHSFRFNCSQPMEDGNSLRCACAARNQWAKRLFPASFFRDCEQWLQSQRGVITINKRLVCGSGWKHSHIYAELVCANETAVSSCSVHLISEPSYYSRMLYASVAMFLQVKLVIELCVRLMRWNTPASVGVVRVSMIGLSEELRQKLLLWSGAACLYFSCGTLVQAVQHPVSCSSSTHGTWMDVIMLLLWVEATIIFITCNMTVDGFQSGGNNAYSIAIYAVSIYAVSTQIILLRILYERV